MATNRIAAAKEMLKARREAAAGAQKATATVTAPKPIDPVKPVVQAKAPVPKGKSNEYDDLDKVTVSLRNTPKVWSDDHLKQINIIKFEHQTAESIIHLGQSAFASIRDGTFLSSDIDVLVNLAISLIKPESRTGNDIYVLNSPPEGYGKIIDTPTVEAGSGVETTRKVTERKLASINRTIAQAKGESLEKLQAAKEKLEKQLTDETPADPPQGVRTEEAYAYAYLAAYCMRLPGKTPNSWVDKLDVAKRRFTNWYDHTSTFLTNFTMTEDAASKLKDALARKQEWVSTWIMWISYNESENKDLNPNTGGMLKYLATQMYSYTALHAYSYIVQIQSESGISFKILLSQLDCPATRSAVKEVANIIRNYEVTEAHPDRKTYFRYARVWDAGYFSSLQTSQCKILARVAGRTQQMLSSKADGSDPTGAYALKNMDPKLIESLDAVSDRLFEVIMEASTNDDKSGGIWKNTVILTKNK
ncbi:TPA_asm: N [Triticum alphacytorhabdovirus 1]|nr:TPA_asm: N [Triticum alphacytorhabdovirus 1]